MQNQKRITTLVGIIIIVVVAVVAFGGVFAYQYFSAKVKTTAQTSQTVKSSVTVASLNGGDILTVGQKYNISWYSDGPGAGQPVEIDLERKKPTDSQFWNIGVISKNQPGSGSYQWTVSADDTTGQYVSGAQYKILIGRNLSSGTGQVDESNDFFSIISPKDPQARLPYEIQYPADFADVNNLTIVQLDPLYTYMGACLESKNSPLPPVGTDFCYIGNQKPDGFAAASLTIATDASISEQDCQKIEPIAPIKEVVSGTPEIINNITFYHSKFDQAGLGHFLSTDYYRTYHQGMCYKINLNIETYRYLINADQDVGPGPSAEFLSAMNSKLKSILSTFKFTTPTDQTAGWKTFSDSYGFRMSYPTDTDVMIITPTSRIVSCDASNALNSCPKGISPGYPDKTENQTINGVNYCFYLGDNCGAGSCVSNYSYLTTKNNVCYVLDITSGEYPTSCNNVPGSSSEIQRCEAKEKARQALIDQAISTIKFIK